MVIIAHLHFELQMSERKVQSACYQYFALATPRAAVDVCRNCVVEAMAEVAWRVSCVVVRCG